MQLSFPGPAGALEGILEEPDGAVVRGAAIVCHPHPLHGGSLRNTIVVRTARALRSARLATLRFNFRGVEGSEGQHDGNGAERGDARAALDVLAERYPELPLWAAGYSFGARTVCELTAAEERVRHVVMIALPVAVYPSACLEHVSVPGLLVFGSRDTFGTAALLRRAWPELPQRLEVLELDGADHFFRGRTPLVEEAVGAHAQRHVR